MPYKMKQNHISNIPDFKSPQDQWIKSYTVAEPDLQTVYHTRSSILWRSILVRCRDSKNYPSWAGCEVQFEGYQEFTDWCQRQYGYMSRESGGRFWAIDKDLKVEGNRVYAPELCMFVPNRINNLFNIKSKDNGLPCGVSTYQTTKLYRWSCSDGKNRLWGSAPTPEEAHRCWQLSKIKIISDILTESEYGPEVMAVLEERLENILYEYDNYIETKHRNYK